MNSKSSENWYKPQTEKIKLKRQYITLTVFNLSVGWASGKVAAQYIAHDSLRTVGERLMMSEL